MLSFNFGHFDKSFYRLHAVYSNCRAGNTRIANQSRLATDCLKVVLVAHINYMILSCRPSHDTYRLN